MGMSTTLKASVLNHLLRTGTWAKPTDLAVSLHSADPGANGASEISGGGYARASIGAPADAKWSDPASTGKCENASTLTFPEATATWPTATHWGLWDGVTFQVGGALSQSLTVQAGQIPRIAINALDVIAS